jgi:hypothetical protein
MKKSKTKQAENNGTYRMAPIGKGIQNISCDEFTKLMETIARYPRFELINRPSLNPTQRPLSPDMDPTYDTKAAS